MIWTGGGTIAPVGVYLYTDVLCRLLACPSAFKMKRALQRTSGALNLWSFQTRGEKGGGAWMAYVETSVTFILHDNEERCKRATQAAGTKGMDTSNHVPGGLHGVVSDTTPQ